MVLYKLAASTLVKTAFTTSLLSSALLERLFLLVKALLVASGICGWGRMMGVLGGLVWVHLQMDNNIRYTVRQVYSRQVYRNIRYIVRQVDERQVDI